MSLFNIVTGLAAMLAVTIMAVIPSTQDAADVLRKILLFLPNYCFGQALSDLYTNWQYLDLFKKVLSNPEIEQGIALACQALPSLSYCKVCLITSPSFDGTECCREINIPGLIPSTLTCPVPVLSLDTPGVGRYVIGMGAQVVVFLFLLLAVEQNLLTSLIARIRHLTSGTQTSGKPNGKGALCYVVPLVHLRARRTPTGRTRR